MRYVLTCMVAAAAGWGLLAGGAAWGQASLPEEPVEIGHVPQFFVDDYMVENRWALAAKDEALVRRFHTPIKYSGNPVIEGDGGYCTLAWDEDAGLYRMYYQDWWVQEPRPNLKYTYAVKYAESEDGLHWVRPIIGKYEWKGSKQNNVVYRGPNGNRAQSPYLIEAPEEHTRGFKFIMLLGKTPPGVQIIGSHDGIHWDPADGMIIAPGFHPDTHNSIVWDGRAQEFVWHTRSTNIYRGDVSLKGGATRRVSRITSKQLWTEWNVAPQNILIPDFLDAESDFNFFYGMPSRYYAGVFWGFLEPFKRNTTIYTELAFSRDGMSFRRFPGRPRFIDVGPEGSWDDGMTFGSPQWIGKGDEWLFFYSAYDGPHESHDRTPGIGLAKLRKEGFASLHGPESGGVVVTRSLVWPGGPLLVNCNAQGGELKVRVVDAQREQLEGYGYEQSVPFSGNAVRHEVQWQERSMNELLGAVIRIEFYLTNADLYAFVAGTDE